MQCGAVRCTTQAMHDAMHDARHDIYIYRKATFLRLQMRTNADLAPTEEELRDDMKVCRSRNHNSVLAGAYAHL